jgi:hypothetical protein
MCQILTRNSAGSGACCRRAPQATHAHPAQTNVCLPLLLSMLLGSSSFASAAIDLVHHSLRLRGCDLDATDFKGRSPLAIACMAGNSPLPLSPPPSSFHCPFSPSLFRPYISLLFSYTSTISSLSLSLLLLHPSQKALYKSYDTSFFAEHLFLMR